MHVYLCFFDFLCISMLKWCMDTRPNLSGSYIFFFVVRLVPPWMTFVVCFHEFGRTHIMHYTLLNLWFWNGSTFTWNIWIFMCICSPCVCPIRMVRMLTNYHLICAYQFWFRGYAYAYVLSSRLRRGGPFENIRIQLSDETVFDGDFFFFARNAFFGCFVRVAYTTYVHQKMLICMVFSGMFRV